MRKGFGLWWITFTGGGEMYVSRRLKADAILAIMLDCMSEVDRRKLDVEHYQNGRECGYAVTRTGHLEKVAFSENRNSDEIVLYSGTLTDFEMSGNVPSKEVYEKRVLFQSEKYVEAARMALNRLSFYLDS